MSSTTRPGLRAPERLHGALDDQREDLRFEVGPRAGAEPGQVEEVLDDDVQAIGVGRDVRDHRRPDVLVEVVAAGLEEPGVAEDRRDRRPELVRDEAEELVLDGVRCLEGVSRGAYRPLGLVSLRDVDEHVHGADHRAGVVEQRRRVGHERDVRAVGADRDRLATADRPGFLEA